MAAQAPIANESIDLDIVLEMLEDGFFDNEGEIQNEFENTTKDIKTDPIECKECKKVYQTKRGLARHVKAKHKPNDKGSTTAGPSTTCVLSEEQYCKIVAEAAKSLASDACFLPNDQQIFDSYSFDLTNTDSKKGYDITCKQLLALEDGANAEKFYKQYYAQVVLGSSLYFPGLPEQSTVALAIRVADSLLSFYNTMNNQNKISDSIHITEREKFAMQYLGGYVLFNLNKKFHKPTCFSKPESQQCIMILQAGRCEDGSNQKLEDTLSRGGLWKINETVQEILLITEKEFRKNTDSVLKKKHIDITAVVENLVRNVTVVSLFQNWMTSAEVSLSETISFAFLEKLLFLYLRVRSFSCTKDIVNKYRVKNKKEKALRTALKKPKST